MTERIEALTLAGELATAYPGRTVTEDHARAWAREFESVDESVARKAAALLRSRSSDPPSVAQVRQAVREASGQTMSDGWSSWRCVFADGVTCPQCGEVHGHLLPPHVVAHGFHHTRSYLAGNKSERDSMLDPEHCDCGYVAEAAL